MGESELNLDTAVDVLDKWRQRYGARDGDFSEKLHQVSDQWLDALDESLKDAEFRSSSWQFRSIAKECEDIEDPERFKSRLFGHLVGDLCSAVSHYYLIDEWADYKCLTADSRGKISKVIDHLDSILKTDDLDELNGVLLNSELHKLTDEWDVSEAPIEAARTLIQAFRTDLEGIRERAEGPTPGRGSDDGYRWVTHQIGRTFDQYFDEPPTSENRIQFVQTALKLVEGTGRGYETVKKRLSSEFQPEDDPWDEPWATKGFW